jgi:hypothetical protein
MRAQAVTPRLTVAVVVVVELLAMVSETAVQAETAQAAWQLSLRRSEKFTAMYLDKSLHPFRL